MTRILALENLCGPGKPLSREAPDQPEFDGLVRSGKIRLKDAQNVHNAMESRFDLAYNAAHALSLAALRKLGYRAQHRYIVFQLLPHTLDLGSNTWRVLDKCHNQRNIAEYEGLLEVDEVLLNSLLAATSDVLNALQQRSFS
jgi:hypothetical protein